MYASMTNKYCLQDILCMCNWKCGISNMPIIFFAVMFLYTKVFLTKDREAEKKHDVKVWNVNSPHYNVMNVSLEDLHVYIFLSVSSTCCILGKLNMPFVFLTHLRWLDRVHSLDTVGELKKARPIPVSIDHTLENGNLGKRHQSFVNNAIMFHGRLCKFQMPQWDNN